MRNITNSCLFRSMHDNHFYGTVTVMGPGGLPKTKFGSLPYETVIVLTPVTVKVILQLNTGSVAIQLSTPSVKVKSPAGKAGPGVVLTVAVKAAGLDTLLPSGGSEITTVTVAGSTVRLTSDELLAWKFASPL